MTSPHPGSQPHAFLLGGHAGLPDYCEPSSPLLLWISSTLHVCIPTPLAFTSTLFGYISILSWLFAQLPQIIKNHKLRSTSGLSVFFLVEWCLGDMSNLAGAILTNQAAWQIIIGAYYCMVDLALVGQWIWFEGLGREHKIKRVWRKVGGSRGRGGHDESPPRSDGGMGAHPETLCGIDPNADDQAGKTNGANTPVDVPGRDGGFRTPHYGSIKSSKDELASSQRSGDGKSLGPGKNVLSSASPRTVLLISMVICMASTTVSANPLPVVEAAAAEPQAPEIARLGTILSWISTVLYLCSRLPQLVKNARLRSTAGLSPLLFAAAFFGNLFYSSSLLLNPNLWNDFPPYGGRGWVGPEGNDRAEWMLGALPFWIGSAGVLAMDASIGVQFWLWGEKNVDGRGEHEVLVIESHGNGKRKWQEVHGWMRGWMPDVRNSFSRVRARGSREDARAQEPLLGGRQ